MARYKRDYSGEKRTAGLRVQLTPGEREALEEGAKRAGTSLSEHARELCMRRSAAALIVADSRRNPETRALIAELTAIGNNINQLARIANIHKEAPQREELKAASDLLKAALNRVLTL